MKKNLLTVLFVTAICLVITGCGKNNKTIIGKWETKIGNYSFVYTFNKDKTCTYDAAGTIMKCTYETKGKSISILYNGDTVPFESTYSIKGNKLNIKDSLGEDTIYTRK